MSKCKVMTGTVCAVLGVTAGYALYQLKEVGFTIANKITDNYIEHYNSVYQYRGEICSLLQSNLSNISSIIWVGLTLDQKDLHPTIFQALGYVGLGKR